MKNQLIIPKTIHYIWVGPNDIPPKSQKIINSWSEILFGYEIKKWDETNLPLEFTFVKEMYKRKRWAFVSDYLRFWILKEYGGIYLDTDMEVLKNLDRFSGDNFFAGKTSSDGFISCGIIGSKPHHFFLEKILEEYDNFKNYDNPKTSPEMMTAVYETMTTSEREQITIYSPEIFYPCNVDEKCSSEKLKQAYTNHLWHESWVPFKNFRKFLRNIGLLSFLKKIFKK